MRKRKVKVDSGLAQETLHSVGSTRTVLSFPAAHSILSAPDTPVFPLAFLFFFKIFMNLLLERVEEREKKERNISV